jgi:hypothetical protein
MGYKRARRAKDDVVDSTADQAALPGVVVNEVISDVVRVEKSLQSIGFFSSAKRYTSSRRTVTQLVKQPDGKRVQARAVITAPEELGLPTTADRDKYMALMKIILDRRAVQGRVSNPIRFTGYELLKTLRLSFSGQHYDEINEWLRRMTATTIMSEAIVFLADRKEYVTDIFHVFDQVTLHGQERADGTRAEEYEIFLSRWQLQNINAGFLLPMDLNAYLELRRDIAKALFGHLHVWFFASRGRSVEKGYRDFCDLLNIRKWPHLSKIKQILSPALNELMSIGYLSSWDVVKQADDSGYKVLLSPGARLLTAPALAGSVSPLRVGDAEIPGWVRRLSERGVQEAVARQLALDLEPGQAVDDQIDYIDALLAEAKKGKIRNPPGLYVSLIRDKILPPPGFETSSRRQLREAREQRQEAARSAQLRFENDYLEHCEKLLKEWVNGQFRPDELDRQIRARRQMLKSAYGHLPEQTQDDIARGSLMSEWREQIPLPGREEFRRSRPPATLFDV